MRSVGSKLGSVIELTTSWVVPESSSWNLYRLARGDKNVLMTRILVAYDTHSHADAEGYPNAAKRSENILTEIKNHDWVKLSESCYIVEIPEPDGPVVKKLVSYIHKGDEIYFSLLAGEVLGFGPALKSLEKLDLKYKPKT